MSLNLHKIKPIFAGDKFGEWTAVTGERINGSKALFRCRCGIERILVVAEARSHKTNSCGCMRLTVQNGYKFCTGCNTLLSTDHFHVVYSRNKILAHRCKACSYVKLKAWRQTTTGKESTKQTGNRQRASLGYQEWQAAHNAQPHIIEARRQYAAEYQINNRDRNTLYHRLYHANHPKDTIQMKLTRDAYLKTDRGREVMLAYVHRYRANLNAVSSTLSKDEWTSIKDYFGNCCAYCGIYCIRPTVEHVIPLSKGGQHNADNVVPACRPCNCSKGAKSILMWMLTRSSSREISHGNCS